MERDLSTMKGDLQQVQDAPKQRGDVLVDAADLVVEITDNLNAKFEELVKQTMVDNLPNGTTLREGMRADNKVAFSELKTELLGPMSVTLTSLNQTVQAVEKEFRIFRVAAAHPAPKSKDIIANLNHVEELMGQSVPIEVLDTLSTNAISEEPPAGELVVAVRSPTFDVDVAQLQGVPSTPTPDTSSAQPTLTVEQTQYLLPQRHA